MNWKFVLSVFGEAEGVKEEARMNHSENRCLALRKPNRQETKGTGCSHLKEQMGPAAPRLRQGGGLQGAHQARDVRGPGDGPQMLGFKAQKQHACALTYAETQDTSI